MKTNAFCGLVLSTCLLLAGSAATYGHDGTIALAHPVQRITIDGDLGDWPEDGPRYRIEALGEGDAPSTPRDLTAWFRAGYDRDENALYVAVEVEDDEILRSPPEGVAPFYNTQDGCEVYVDLHCLTEPNPPMQLFLWGTRRGAVSLWGTIAGAISDADTSAFRVVAATGADRITYEWRLDLASLSAGRVRLERGHSIGLDVAVEDVDTDGNPSWISWSPGTGKWNNSGRIADLILVDGTAAPGNLRGRMAWQTGGVDVSTRTLPRLARIRSLTDAALWIQVPVDSATGQYAAPLPAGRYEVTAVDAQDNRILVGPRVEAHVVAGRPTEAELLRVVPMEPPQLVSQEGIFTSPQPLDPDEVDRFVRAWMDYLKIPGMSLALIRDGEIAYHRSYGVKNAVTGELVDDRTLFEAASMTKPVFAYAVHRLVDRGVLDLDTPLYRYLPYPDAAGDERYKRITAIMVLSHSTGFPNWRTGTALPILFDPGTAIGYSGEGFEYLKVVVAHLTGKDPEQLVEDEVFRPLGMDNAYLAWRPEMEPLAATGHIDGDTPIAKWHPEKPVMASSLHVDAVTYARFLTALMRGTGLSANRRQDMVTLRRLAPFEAGSRSGEIPQWPGLGVFVSQEPCGMAFGHGGHNGGFTSQSWIYPERGVGYVFLINNEQAESFDRALRPFLVGGTAQCARQPRQGAEGYSEGEGE